MRKQALHSWVSQGQRNPVALENCVYQNHQHNDKGAPKRATDNKYQFCQGRIIYGAFRPNDVEVEGEQSRKIEHIKNNGRPRDVDEPDRDEALHA